MEGKFDFMKPNDDVLFEILHRLPGKSILRFKSVSKAWDVLLSTAYFAHAHNRRVKPSMLTISNDDIRSVPLSSRVPEVTKRNILISLRSIKGVEMGMRACCHGLLCFEGRRILCKEEFHAFDYERLSDELSTHYYYIHNPFTKEWFDTPGVKYKDGILLAFYFCPVYLKYRLLRCFDNDLFDTFEPKFEIFTVGQANSWRQIECFSDTRDLTSLVALIDQTRFLRAAPILLNMNLHWVPVTIYIYPKYSNCFSEVSSWALEPNGEDNAILVFETVSEKFRLMSLPPTETLGLVDLFELQELLAVSNIVDNAKLELWILDDYNKEVWVRERMIELESIPNQVPTNVFSSGTDDNCLYIRY